MWCGCPTVLRTVDVAGMCSPGQARDAARRFLAGLGPVERAQAEAVLLVVSELVTNAVRHAGGVTGFRLDAGSGRVGVTVCDESPVPPRPRALVCGSRVGSAGCWCGSWPTT